WPLRRRIPRPVAYASVPSGDRECGVEPLVGGMFAHLRQDRDYRLRREVVVPGQATAVAYDVSGRVRAPLAKLALDYAPSAVGAPDGVALQAERAKQHFRDLVL